MKTADKLIQLVLIISIPLFLLTSAVRLITSTPFLTYEYRKASFPADVYGFSAEERFRFAQSALEYVRDPQPVAFLASQTFEEQPLYSKRELSHMVDVQSVFQAVWKVWWVSIFLILGSATWLLSAAENRLRFARAVTISGAGTAVSLFTLGLFAVLGWETWFTSFHRLFFIPGSWTFSPTDTLIRLFPISFWYDSALSVSGLTLVGGALTALVGVLLKTRVFRQSVKKVTKLRIGQKKQPVVRKEWPLSVYGWMIGLAVTGYLFGMFVFGENSHPLHWAAALFGLVFGCWIGWVIIYWKGYKAKQPHKRS